MFDTVKSFLKIGNRHLYIETKPKTTKREVVSKVLAIVIALEDNTPAEVAKFNKIDTFRLSDARVNQIYSDLKLLEGLSKTK